MYIEFIATRGRANKLRKNVARILLVDREKRKLIASLAIVKKKK